MCSTVCTLEGFAAMTRFTSGEQAVMALLWQHGELKPADIQKQFPWEIKNPALRSHLTILLNKGHVVRRKVGKAFYYKAATPKQNAFQRTLTELIDNYCGGSARSLLLNLIQHEKMSEAELLELQRLASGGAPERRRGRKKSAEERCFASPGFSRQLAQRWTSRTDS